MQPTAAPWARTRDAGDGGEPPAAGARAAATAAATPQEQAASAVGQVPGMVAGPKGLPLTAAPWAKGVTSAPLPAVSRGELTKAPWAAASGPALTG